MAAWRPDLVSLRLFVGVCDEASIARAAERENIVASAISKRMAEMEEAMGVELLVRGGRGVKPTQAGKTLLHHARQILRSTEKLQTEMADHAQGIGGHVRLIANISALAQFLPRDLSSFLSVNSAIGVDLEEAVSSGIIEAVRDSAADFGICQDFGDIADLHLMTYASDRLVLVTEINHPLAGNSLVAFADTLNYQFVGLRPDSRMTAMLTGAAARMGRSINHRMHVATFDVAAHLIAEKLAIGILPEGAVRHLQQRLALCITPLEDDWARRRMVICMRDYHALSRPARLLVDHLHRRGRERGEPTAVLR